VQTHFDEGLENDGALTFAQFFGPLRASLCLKTSPVLRSHSLGVGLCPLLSGVYMRIYARQKVGLSAYMHGRVNAALVFRSQEQSNAVAVAIALLCSTNT